MSKTIGQLDPATLDGTELVEIEQGGVSMRTTVQEIVNRASATSASQLAGINDQAGVAYTLVLGDAGKDVRCTNAGAITLTVPDDATVDFPIGTWLLFSQGGAGTVTAAPAAGVVLNAPNGATTTAQDDVRGLEKVAAGTWRVL